MHHLMGNIAKEAPGVWPNATIITQFLTCSQIIPEQLANGWTMRTTEFRYKNGRTAKFDNIIEIPNACMFYFPLSDSLLYRNEFND